MKSRIAASISFMAGARSRNICRSVSVQRAREAFNFGLARVQCQEFGSSNRSIHSSSEEDDSFEELGLPVTKCVVSQLKLATEKPTHFWKNDSARKASPNKSALENKNDKKGTPSTSNESCQTMAEPIDAATANSSIGKIRIQGIGKHVSIHEIHSVCRKVGNVEGLAWVGKDAVDAFFCIGSESHLRRILKKLNGTTICDSHLSASLLSSNSTASMSKNESDWHENRIQLRTTIDELKRQYESKKIDLEDLDVLCRDIIHIQRPPTMSD